MRHSRSLVLPVVCLGLGLGSCSRQTASPSSPTAHALAATTSGQNSRSVVLVGAPASSPEVQGVEIVQSAAAKPDGFQASVFSDPRRDETGVIVGSSPITVEFDACRSTSGDGSPLYYYFDWEFDHRANVWGTGDACLQKHTFRAKPVDGARGDDTFRANVCVATGDLNRHDPATYVSCREFTIRVPQVEACNGAQPDSFPHLTAPAGMNSAALGNVYANDCPVEVMSNAGGGFDFVNITTVFQNFNGTFTMICTAPGPFSGHYFYTTSSGDITVFVAGTCQ